MGTETTKIALNTHVHLRTANQKMSRARPERNVDDITDMSRSCRLRQNTSSRRPIDRRLSARHLGCLRCLLLRS